MKLSHAFNRHNYFYYCVVCFCFEVLFCTVQNCFLYFLIFLFIKLLLLGIVMVSSQNVFFGLSHLTVVLRKVYLLI